MIIRKKVKIMHVELLKNRFMQNMHRHAFVEWSQVESFLTEDILKAVSYMEKTKGEPDVVSFEDQLCICDFSKESPQRRSLCYDKEARLKRKQNAPVSSVMEDAQNKKLVLLNEAEYVWLQSMEDLDLKTSSWIKTEESMRKQGGALFGSKRYGRTFIYCNGADSYYSSRGYRAKVVLKTM